MAFEKGRAKTGGRAPGTPNKATLERAEALAEALASCKSLTGEAATMTPLGVLLTVMRMAWAKESYGTAVKMAIEAAPYVHPKLASASLDVRKHDERKSDEELRAELDAVRAKAQAAVH
jgi:hypothetical protein